MMIRAVSLLAVMLVPTGAFCADPALPGQAAAALEKAVTFLRTEVAAGGGYLGSYRFDPATDEIVEWVGEGRATKDQNWTQPPGNPSVGFAFLRAWEGTGDPQYLEAAVEVAHSLVYGQLECGGWDYIVDHGPEGPRRWYYRHNAGSAEEALKSGRNRGTFDDDVSQHATRLLIAVDQALEGGDEGVHDAALYALDYILRAQGPEGGWPQVFPLTGRGYNDFYTFNDNSIADCADVMMIAWRAYGDRRYHDAVVRAGEFIIKVQQPEPQPTWAQQYDHDLKPAWARRFEPASVTAGESRGVIRTLIRIALFTGDERYLAPIATALDWYKRSELSVLTGRDEGRWARFYEIGTNRPLYCRFEERSYMLTYDDDDLPDHYSFKGNYYPRSEERDYLEITEKGIERYLQDRETAPLSTEEKLRRAEAMEENVRGIIAAQDTKGRWMQGDWIRMATVGRSIETLAAYLRLVNDR